ncbi:MAG: polyphosphate kinase 2 family protein [Phycisphaerales bacterium]|nr:MAG: polyphosphate kinase 2 family protein [Phycisphaerales bacterium]
MFDIDDFRVKPGSKVDLKKIDPGTTKGLNRDEGEDLLKKNRKKLDDLQYLLYAEDTRSILLVLQAMDAGGKDGTIRDVFEGVNPQGVHVTSFKAPSSEELEHDYLWRIHKATPRRGEMGVFNRSHYESVLVERVKGLAPEHVWRPRYAQINAFESHLAACGTMIVKCYLHISKEEQLERLKRRLNDPKRQWKMNPADFEERKRWDAYMEAFEDAIELCSTAACPWYIVPSDCKWYRNAVISTILVKMLEKMDPKLPRMAIDPSLFKVE